MDGNTNQPVLSDKTWLAAILAIVLVIPAMFVAGIVVVIYSFCLRMELVDKIPYIGTIALIWFPELLRGLLTGALAISITRYIIERWQINPVRYSVLVFWGIIMAAIIVMDIKEHGTTRDNISFLISLIGFPIGLWIVR